MPPPAHGLAPRLIAGPTLRMQSDRRLVRLVREGYETAFEEIVRRYGRPLGRYAAAIVGSRAEDVTQDAFSKALVALRRDEAEIELRPWLYRIVRNTALNDLRDRPPAAAELAEAIAGGESPAERVEQREELTELMERLRALPEAQRAAIAMRELEGLSHDEIAAALGMSGGAARQAIYRARRALRDAAGMLVPLPLLKAALTADSAAAAEAAGGAIGFAGAGMAVKATAATVLVAGTVGAGVALQEGAERKDRDARAQVATRDSGNPPAPGSAGSSGKGGQARSGPGGGEGSNSGPGGGGEDRDGEGRRGEQEDERDEDSGRSGSGSGRSGTDGGEDRSGPGGGELDPGDGSGAVTEIEVADSSGPSESSGSSGDSGSGSLSSGTSGSGSSGSGSIEGSSGSSESSWSGSGSSGSGSESSGSSGSGSDDGDGDDG